MVNTMSEPDLADAIGDVRDPEIPVLTIADLGILRSVEHGDGTVIVTITPTYSGCPAMDVIRSDIEAVAARFGMDVEVRTVLAPAWTTDWMSAEGRDKLLDYGVAPPAPTQSDSGLALCPQCRSADTRTVSEFGSTACKALMVCSSCGEPFDRFKSI